MGSSKPLDLDKLRSIRQGGRTAGTARIRTTTDPATGRTTGHTVDYADGRTAAVVRPATVAHRVSIGGNE